MQIAEIELLKRCIAQRRYSGPSSELNTERINAERNYLTTTLIARDLPSKKRETKILDRGEYDKPIGEALNTGYFPYSVG